MTQRLLYILAALTLAAVGAVADDNPDLPDAPGKATVVKVCGACHGAEIVLGKPHSEDGWNEIVVDMVQRGAEGTDEELDQVVKYLTKNITAGQAQAKVNVNKASAKAIQAGLGFTEKEAQAIVEARAKAPFKSIEDVKKVPGLDAAKVDAKKDKMVFQ
ncbi:MAG TPA: helix-hairpin-helix domain-containing protein [Bryobacteraceae bacterium]|jgi:competence protein ComEA